jgi:hypothetical protein
MNVCSPQVQNKIIAKMYKTRGLTLEGLLSIIREDKLLSNYTFEQTLNEFDQRNRDILQKVLNSLGYKSDLSISQNIEEAAFIITKKVHNINTKFRSTNVTEMFSGMNLAEKYFMQELNNKVIKATVLGQEDSPFLVRNNLELNINLRQLKNEAFKTIVEWLNNTGNLKDPAEFYDGNVFKKPLYNANGKVLNYDLYNTILKTFESLIFKDVITTSTGKVIPNLYIDANLQNSKELLDAYNAALLLSNFDNIINKYFPNIIKIDYTKFNELESVNINGKDKYSLKIDGKKEMYWLDDDHMSQNIANIEADLTKRIISTIPRISTLPGESSQLGNYLTINDLYSLFSTIHE